MDPRTHRRFLEYVEKFEYFGRAELSRLTRQEWESLDSELAPLRDKQARDVLSANELTRVVALRRVLLVD